VEIHLPDDELYAFDLDQWYLRHDGSQWGPIDTQQLLDLLHEGKVRGSTLVRRDRDIDWKPLESVPGTESWFALPEKQDEAVVAVFHELWSAIFFENLAITYLLTSLIFTYLVRRQSAVVGELWIFLLLPFVAALRWSLHERPGRIEVTDRSIRRVVGDVVMASLPLTELDRQPVFDTSVFERATGRRFLRSASGRRLAIRRRWMRRSDYRMLMQTLRIEA
jgi:hypothetical protein